MSGWSFDMTTAPRGEHREVTRKIGKTEVTKMQHFTTLCFVAGADGKTVTPSRWLDDQGRWEMFTKDVPPIAWMPWPSHPGVTA